MKIQAFEVKYFFTLNTAGLLPIAQLLVLKLWTGGKIVNANALFCIRVPERI
jgi:hypothetical protein